MAPPSTNVLTAPLQKQILPNPRVPGRSENLPPSDKLQLFKPIDLGDGLVLKNRLCFAPCTRRRCSDIPHYVPEPFVGEYYAQRASCGLLISEATNISHHGVGSHSTPGIWSEEQVARWTEIVQEVHASKGVFFCQLWHTGRQSHSYFQPGNEPPLAPSAVRPKLRKFVKPYGMVEVETPKKMTLDDIKEAIEEYRHAAANAKKAGFDGVELHGANGYIVDQFLQDVTNKREQPDPYSFYPLENRLRFLREALEAILTVYPPNRVGVRFSPFGHAGDMQDASVPLTQETFKAAIALCTELKLAYVHLVEPPNQRAPDHIAGNKEQTFDPESLGLDQFLSVAKGSSTLRMTCGYKTRDRAAIDVEDERAELVAVGQFFISNPDLVDRYYNDFELTPWDHDYFYNPDRNGYTNYPTYGMIKQAGLSPTSPTEELLNCGTKGWHAKNEK
ncbi:FMN-linked oxidoreductase [Gonapodya prolifera JEL478]|uniref:FMN-linked oxidoreductase n=1 Tax=Gonapodya prolifera (strain JEL478) TaxID=1344416 RepID=A0A139AWH2_GONPJ|nr:FMN-linked oxidoreductase [Gonapodya prolifera JEL478]|eukprot:KXS21054.1 FMN-linked oxidoreductase [Gonapodya prolifera JEL478]